MPSRPGATGWPVVHRLLCAVLGLALAACGAQQEAAPAPEPVAAEAWRVQTGVPEGEGATAPMPASTLPEDYIPYRHHYADTLFTLHEVFTERLRAAAAQAPAETVLPFVNAVSVGGIGWSLEREGKRLAGPTEDGWRVWPPGIHPELDPEVTGTTSAPTPQEDDLLARMQAGGTVQWQVWEGRLHVAGPLPASADCRRCHDAAPGALLGAYLYDLREIPDD